MLNEYENGRERERRRGGECNEGNKNISKKLSIDFCTFYVYQNEYMYNKKNITGSIQRARRRGRQRKERKENK